MATWTNIYRDEFDTLDPAWVNIVSGGSTATRPTIVSGQLTAQRFTILEHSGNLLLDPKNLYRITARIASGAQSAAQGFFYLGVTGIAANGTTRVSTTGADAITNQHYFAASRRNTALDQFTNYSGYWMGSTSVNADAGGEHLSPLDPGKTRTPAVYVRPLMYLGSPIVTPDTSVTKVESFRIDMIVNAIGLVRVSTADAGAVAWLEIQSWETEEYARSSAVLNVVGRPDPIVLTDVLRTPSSTITFLTRSQFDIPALLDVLGSTQPIQITSPCPSVPNGWYSVLSVTKNRLTNKGNDFRMLWEAQVQQVVAP